jgi:hypothetical protein
MESHSCLKYSNVIILGAFNIIRSARSIIRGASIVILSAFIIILCDSIDIIGAFRLYTVFYHYTVLLALYAVL